MPFNDLSLLIYLYGSILFCWAAVSMARAGQPVRKFDFQKPQIQLRVAIISFLFLLAAAAAARVFHKPLEAFGGTSIDYIFAGLATATVAAAALIARDNLSSVGLSLRGMELILFFLVPPAGLIFLHGHLLNLKFLLRGLSPAIAAAAFSEELFFRGYLQTRLQSLFGARNGLLAAAAAYTIFRLPMMWGQLPPAALAVHLAGTFLVWGCAAGMIYRRAGNIYGLVLFHIFWDAALQVFAGLAVM